jgi:serine/threonine protein kinase
VQNNAAAVQELAFGLPWFGLCSTAGLCVAIVAVGIAVVTALLIRNRHARALALSRDTDQAATGRCRVCGLELPSAAPQGLCPRCLLHVAIDDRAPAPALRSTAAYNPAFAAMTCAELASHFPHLEILELLGKGGMGAVYKARQPHLDRFVALKVLPPESARDPAFAERFAREARALARLNHPNIVGVHDFGDSSGLYWLLMEYVDGVNLRQAMRAGQLTPEEALRIVPQLCDALQFAHDEGVVHRDIKPENILLDKRGRVKVADFGLAKLLGQSAADTGLTGTQQVLGTLHYMAPEQLAGARTVDHRADIYALGVTFYEMLTGELPLGRFPPPSKKVAVDARLDAVVLRTLEYEPAERFQHASDIRTAIEVIAGHPPPRLTASLPRRTREHWPELVVTISEGVRNEIRRAGSWLTAAGRLSAIASAALAIYCLVGLLNLEHPSDRRVFYGWTVVYVLWTLVAAPLMISGGRALCGVRSLRLAVLGVLLAMLPLTPAALIGLPVGVWCLTILCRRDVREEFARAASRANSGT